mgnify:FL=1
MIKMKGTVLKLGVVFGDEENKTMFSKECDLKFGEKVDIVNELSGVWQYRRNYILGTGVITREEDNLVIKAEIDMPDDIEKLYYLSRYINVKSHSEDSITVVDRATLLCLSVIDVSTVVDDIAYLEKIEEDDTNE